MPHPHNLNTEAHAALANVFTGRHELAAYWLEQTSRRLRDVDIKNAASDEIPIVKFGSISDTAAIAQICQRVQDAGFAAYEWISSSGATVEDVTNVLQALSLKHGDNGVMRDAGELSLLEDLSGTAKGRFPPYSSKAIQWHTDGYYNAHNDSIRCFTLHCLSPAASGGALVLMDDALLLLAMLVENPSMVTLMSHPNAMTLPQNRDAMGHDRPDRHVPMVTGHDDGSISLRFTTRARNITYRNAETEVAAKRAAKLIEAHPQWHRRIKLKQHQGIVTRNILHARDAFTDASDSPKRQILRGRFTALPHPAPERSHVAR